MPFKLFSNKITFLILVVLMHFSALAQKTAIYTDPVSFYNRGLELFDKEKYGSAINEFEEFLKVSKDVELRTGAEYYTALASLYLQHPDGETKLVNFIDQHPDQPQTSLAHFHLGKYYYEKHNHAKAVSQLKNTNDEVLTFDESVEYHFMLGYSEFMREKYEDAQTEFKIILREKTKYYFPAHYYMGHIALKEGRYDDALEYFNNVKTSKIYAHELPVYYSQVYFAQKRYDYVLSYSDTIHSNKNQRIINWMRGLSYYYLDEYKEALPLMEKNKPEGTKQTATDHYVLGYAYYKNGEYEKAFTEFITINDTKDTLTQYAYYNAAECFIKLNRKANAKDAFYQASLLNYNRNIREKSLFNYAKLSYELSYPDEALNGIKRFLKDFPKSDLTVEAKTLLGEVLLAGKNYREAIEVLESIENMSEQTKRVYQQITFFRAIELLDSSRANASTAMTYLKKSQKYPLDKKIKALSDFWKGEIFYMQDQYKECINSSKDFLAYGDAASTSVYPAAYYNIGYSYFKEDDYSSAASNFKKFVGADNYFTEEKKRYLDGMTRLGDCQFMLKNYEKALDAYTYIISKNGSTGDYCYFQCGIIYGLQNRDELKIQTLKKIPAQFPKSLYVDDALYEIAMVQLKMGNTGDALRGFGYLIEENPRGAYAKKCHLRIGLISYQLNNTAKATEELKIVIESYPNTSESNEAANVLKQIYIDKGDAEGFYEYMAEKGNVRYSQSSQDSASYTAAYTLYTDGNCDQSTKSFIKYISKFPRGYFLVQAHYYKADCQYKAQKFDEALESYLYVLDKGFAEYAEASTRMAATIYYLKKDYEKALPLYEKLEKQATKKDNQLVSLLGQMRCGYYLKLHDKTVANCKKLLAYDKVTREGIIEANLYLGRLYMESGNLAEAETAFKDVLKNATNQYGAEAKYNLALIQYKRKKPDDAQKIVLELRKQFADYDYWIAKGLLLQADMLIEKKDFFQARATLKSIISNYDITDDGIVDEAQQKLDGIGDEE